MRYVIVRDRYGGRRSTESFGDGGNGALPSRLGSVPLYVEGRPNSGHVLGSLDRMPWIGLLTYLPNKEINRKK
jgi:hypothetical protein